MKKISEKNYNFGITVISIILPIVIGILFNIRVDLSVPIFLPPIYALTNAVTALVLITAVIAVKNKRVLLHERLVKIALGLSVLFLFLYIIYHMTSNTTTYGGDFQKVYYFILISHIILSVLVIPFVLITYVKGKAGKFLEHKKIARITFPLWLYVVVSGVVVYLMISPYYK